MPQNQNKKGNAPESMIKEMTQNQFCIYNLYSSTKTSQIWYHSIGNLIL